MKRNTVEWFSFNDAPRRPASRPAVFFILWNPQSERPPQVRFETRGEAEDVARDMAERHGEVFYVCEAVSMSLRQPNPVKTVGLVK